MHHGRAKRCNGVPRRETAITAQVIHRGCGERMAGKIELCVIRFTRHGLHDVAQVLCKGVEAEPVV